MLAAESLLRSERHGMHNPLINNTGCPTVPLELVVVDFENVVERQECHVIHKHNDPA